MILHWIFLVLVSVFCLTAGEIEAQKSGWNLTPNTQYHIQTDEGPERYFRFQTLNGQYRKEKRLADGTVIGTEGWLDPLGYLRIKDYIADSQGYRILRSKMVYVGKERPIQDAVAISKKVPAQSGVLAKPRRPVNPFRQPALADLPGNSIVEANTVTPLRSTVSSPVRNPVGFQYLHPSTPSPEISPPLHAPIAATSSPFRERIPLQNLEDGYSQPNTNHLPNYQFQSPYVSPYQSPYPYHIPEPSVVFQPPVYGEKYPRPSDSVIYQSPSNSVSQAYQTAASQTYPQAFQQNYGSNLNKSYPESSSRTGNVIQGGVNYPTGDQKRVNPDFPEYDGTHTVKDGFQYYLKTHYHEEEQKQPNEDEKIGSFGYIDPFGIRRVIYYKADAQHGFIHKKNNRYVGFQATPYDPQLPTRS